MNYFPSSTYWNDNINLYLIEYRLTLIPQSYNNLNTSLLHSHVILASVVEKVAAKLITHCFETDLRAHVAHTEYLIQLLLKLALIKLARKVE